MVSKIQNNKYIATTFFLLLIIELISINFAKHNYDGFHLGLIINSAQDLENGKLVYRDFFYPYGLLNLYLNNFILNLFNFNIFYLYVFYIQVYICGIFIFSLLVKKIINQKYALYSLVLFLTIHPYILKPWHNYLLFFLITCFIYLKYGNNYKKELLASFILGISFLFSETFFIASFLIFILDLIFYYKFYRLKNIFYKILLFFIPLLLFQIYLIYNNLFDNWIFSSKTFSILLGFFYKQDFLNYFSSYISLYIFSYKKLLSNTHIFFYFIIFLTNIFYVLYKLKNFFLKNDFDDNFLFFISLTNLILISQSLNNISIFKLVTLSSFGIIVLFKLIINTQDYFVKRTFLIIITLLTLMIFFNENYKVFNKQDIYVKNKNQNLKFIQNQKYSINTWNNLIDLENYILEIKKNCKVEYFVNFTNDAFYFYILNRYFKSLQYFYWYQNIHKNYQNTFYLSLYNNFDRGINKKINDQIVENNIIFITDLYNQEKIKFISDDINYDYEFIEFDNYYYKNLSYSKNHGKKILLIPNNCKI